MDMEDAQEEKWPRFFWLIVVAVVVATLAIFLVIQSRRTASKVAEVTPAVSEQVEQAGGPGGPGWPAPDTAAGLPEVAAQESAAARPVEAAEAVEPKTKPPTPAVTTPRSKPKTAPREPVVTPRPDRSDQPVAVPTSPRGRYVVQLGSYKSERLAKVQAAQVDKYGYKAWVESADIPGKGVYYRVRIGGFDNLSDARRVAASMEDILRTRCWVDKR